ncbi:Transcriptional regulator [Seminavis robusta]|uniref:Transcriptional regulator n=1 Tax=Seminavis robusta TaxID=568900 RepID=A0A9N8F1M2_9STRA|nr:Transcriptional regulator [Seminavis robusta]|eukprot:Sro3177_g344800.1 Transcriptional regulator (1136) ;mRNA; f:2859-6266
MDGGSTVVPPSILSCNAAQSISHEMKSSKSSVQQKRREDDRTAMVATSQNDGLLSTTFPETSSSFTTPSSSSSLDWRIDSKSSELYDSSFNLQPSNAKRKLLKRRLSDLTIGKLNVTKIAVVGREDEVQVLKNCFVRMTTSSTACSTTRKRKELIFIKGYSGVGKSTLAKTIEKDVVAASGIYVEGKFDLYRTHEPYSAITQAFGRICRALVHNRPPQVMQRIGDALSQVLGDEVQSLIYLVPELQDIVPIVTSKALDVDDAEALFGAGQEKWKYLFRVLTRVLTAQFSSSSSVMVLVLDDLQWADHKSLEVIDYLISDHQNQNALAIVGCFRSFEVDQDHMLAKSIHGLKAKQEAGGFVITTIELQSLQVNDTNRMVMSILDTDDPEKTRGLAQVCFKRTHGNPFFLIEFIKNLERQEFITFNLGLLKWTWDVDKIDNATMATDNVVDLLQERMRKLPSNLQLLLQYASCLGASFKASTLRLIWDPKGRRVQESKDEADCNTGNIAYMLDSLVKGNFIESCGIQEYRWVHDKVQEAAGSLGNVVTASFRLKVGIELYNLLSAKELDERLFDVADLINQGDAKPHPELAEINLRASDKARNISAFQSAAIYAVNGIRLLPKGELWTTHRTQALRLYTVGAELNLALGNAEEAEAYSNEVLKREDCSVLEKLPLKLAMAHKLSSIDLKYDEMITYCLGALKELGCNLRWKLVPKLVQTVFVMKRTLEAAKKAPDNIRDEVGIMTDPTQLAIVHLLRRVQYASYQIADVLFVSIALCEIVNMTLKHGISYASGPGFACLAGAAVCVFNDLEAADLIGTKALAVQQAVGKTNEADTLHNSYMFSLSWRRPFHTCLDGFAKGYTVGMRRGETEFASWALVSHQVWVPYVMGKPLPSILECCPGVRRQLDELQQHDQETLCRIYWQLIANLTLPSAHAKQLEGAVFSKQEFTSTLPLRIGAVHHAEGELLLFYGDYETLAKRAIRLGDVYEKLIPANLVIIPETFHRCVALYAMARRTRQKKYITHANRVRKKIENWRQQGNPNVEHYCIFLNAEQAAVRKRYDCAEDLFKKAIAMAGRTGHLHHAGLFNERYADFLLHSRSDKEEARYRLKESIRQYEAWGARGVVHNLEKIYCEILAS